MLSKLSACVQSDSGRDSYGIGLVLHDQDSTAEPRHPVAETGDSVLFLCVVLRRGATRRNQCVRSAVGAGPVVTGVCLRLLYAVSVTCICMAVNKKFDF